MTGIDDVKNTVDTALKTAEQLISQNKNGEAIKVLQESINGYTAHNDCLEVTRVLDVLGRLHVEAGDMKQAQHYYSRSLLAKIKEFGIVSRELAVAYRNVASAATDETHRNSNLKQAQAMELPEAEFQLLRGSLLSDDELGLLKRL